MLPALALIFSPQTQPASRAKIWCTGKDSNLRTSQGGADLQSAGFNHSPTCALAVSVEQRALSNHLPLAHSSLLEALSDTPQQSLRLHLATWGSESAREKLPALTTHLEKFPYGVPMEKLSAACPANPVNLELAKGFEPLTL
jgi:hypothetical protein